MSSEAIFTYQSAVQACALVGRILAQHDIPALLADIDEADVLGPLIDPTLYRDKHKAMQQDRDLLKAANVLREYMLKMMAKEVDRG